jgi:signal transduction histidine kinase
MRWRIALAVTALVTLAIVALSVSLLLMMEEREEAFANAVLEQQIGHSMAMWKVSPAAAFPNTPDMRLYRIPHAGEAGEVPVRYRELALGNHEVFEDGREFHVAVRSDEAARYVLFYDVQEHEDRLRGMIVITVTGAVPIVLATLLLGYLLSGRLAARLEALAHRAENGGEGSYARPGMERELLAIARALDAQELRQAELLRRERDFSADLAHELRTPLAGIRSDAELLAGLPGLPEAVSRRAGRIIGSVDRIKALSDSLLLLAREARPQLLEPVALAPLVEACWPDVAAGRPARLRLELPPDGCVMADPALLDLVVRNLLDNACRHAGDGEVCCRLDGTVLTVADGGPGFPPEALERVFDRFHRGPGGRYGLGLALVRHVCLACGWRASAANAPQGGARVSVDFGAALRA